MKYTFAIATAASMLLALGSPRGFASEVQFKAPATVQAQQSAELLDRAAHALNDYLTACARSDQEGAARAITSDAVIEYPLAGSGMYLTVDATPTGNYHGHAFPLGIAVRHISNLWVFPTDDADTVFVQFSLTSNEAAITESADHLALVQMRRNHIARMRVFTANPDPIAAAVD